MKVLLVSGVYPPHIGGPSAQTHQLAQGLICRGIDVHVATFGDTPGQSLVEGVPVTFLNGSQRRNWREKLTKNWQVYQELCQIIKEFQPNIVHQQTAVANLALYTGLASRRHHVRSLIKYSSDLRWERAQQQKLDHELPNVSTLMQPLLRLQLTSLQRFLFALFDRIWVTTPPFQTQLQQYFKVAVEKILLLPNFIDLSAFELVAQDRAKILSSTHPSSNRPFEVLVISRLQPWKGVDTCIRALAELRELPIKVRIVGQGKADYETYLKTLVHTLKLTQQVDFIGQISPTMIHRQYLKADAFVLASSYEPFGIVLVEAMAAGVPIVASDVGGIPSVVKDAAVLVPPKQVQALAHAIHHLFLDKGKRASLIAKGKQRVRAFELDQGIEHLLEEYNHLTH